MKICGIVCEYNPFHNGHSYQIEKTREILGQDTIIVCLMSGNFVQRGDIALFHKNIRANAAIKCGADLVLELPLPYAMSTAETFARSSVDILSKIGCTHISFGAEDENIQDLIDIAKLLLEKSTIDDTIEHLSCGISYASARERAVYNKIQDKAKLLKLPNNILAIEYLKGIFSLKSNIIPITIKRIGAGHDTCDFIDNTASATHIRHCIKNDDLENMEKYIPENAYQLFKNACQQRISHNESIIISQLIRLTPLELKDFADVSEGLEYRLFDAIQSSFSFDEICDKAKSKRYTHARIRRILLNAFLDFKKSLIPISPPYVRVLAFNYNSRYLLSLNRSNEQIALLNKPAHIKKLDECAQTLFDLEVRSSKLYSMFGNSPYINEFNSPLYINN